MYKLDIIVPTHNHLYRTINCLAALYANTTEPFHLIVVDDSTDLTPEYIESFKKDNITFVHSDVPYKSGNQIFNEGIKEALTPYIATVMNSVLVEPEWEIEALKLMDRHLKIGVIGFKCLYPSGLIESAGIRMLKWLPVDIGRDEPSHRFSGIYQCDAVQWAFALLRKEAVEGNLDEDMFNGFKGVDDIDNCFVIRDKGWDIFYCGEGVGYHEPRATRGDNTIIGRDLNAENMTLFYKRWGYLDMFQEGLSSPSDADLVHYIKEEVKV